MSVLKPKTIILTAVQPLRAIQLPSSCYRSLVDLQHLESSMSAADLESLVDDDDDMSSCGSDVPRKRRRLNYLTPQEKMVRRKLKNRVAAQTARDRKKQRMTELEEAMAVLQAENQALLVENTELRSSTDTLEHENLALRERLQTAPLQQQVLATRNPSDVCDIKSAELVVPLPQEQQARTAFQLAAYCVTLLALLSLLAKASTSCVKKVQHQKSGAQKSSGQQQPVPSGRWYPAMKQRPPREWWGRDYPSWLQIGHTLPALQT